MAHGFEPIIEKVGLGENNYLLVQREEGCSDALILVHLNGKPGQLIVHDGSGRNPAEGLDVLVEDYNFDGHMDFAVFNSMGNVQIMYDVYLFKPEIQFYLLSEAMSELPCIGVDADAKKLMGSCFHSNACENWSEAYTVSGFDQLSLAHEWGTRCCPADEDCYYTFSTKYKDGQVVFDEWTRHDLDE